MPAIDRANRKYQILGVHDDKVLTVESNVARVRMYIGDEQVDEDFLLPQALTVERQLDSAIQNRISELINERLASAAKRAEPEAE